jgi:hypothetical protein
MIEKMNLESTFQQSEIQDGDIICFQKDLTEKEYILLPYCVYTFYTYYIIEPFYVIFFFRILEHVSSGRCYEIPKFYKLLTLRILVSFKPKFKDREPKSEFNLILSKNWTYDTVCKILIKILFYFNFIKYSLI